MIIGLCGYSRSGKDTAADVLVDNFGFKKYHLAQTMKDCLGLIFGWDADYIENHKEEIDPTFGISPRQVLRAFGTEFAQQTLCNMFPQFNEKVGRKLWIYSLLAQIPLDQDSVIADVRFLHEAEEIKNAGGIIVRVGRPGYPVDLSHGSEREIADIKWDHLITNSGDLQEYKSLVFEWATWNLIKGL
jgi:hypothetical protein